MAGNFAWLGPWLALTGSQALTRRNSLPWHITYIVMGCNLWVWDVTYGFVCKWNAPSRSRSGSQKHSSSGPGKYEKLLFALQHESQALNFCENMTEKGDKKVKWPLVKRKPDLRLTELKGLHLFTIPNFLTPAESQAFVDTAEVYGFEYQSSQGPAKGEAFRDNHRISLQNEAFAQNLWNAGLSALFKNITVDGKRAIGLNSNIRLYRYTEGQRFGQHIDESVDLGQGCTTEYTLLVYLNSGAKPAKNRNSKTSTSSSSQLVGGETVFYSSRGRIIAEVVPVGGMALFHMHGEKCMVHEARVVSKGAKYVLRSDVVFA